MAKQTTRDAALSRLFGNAASEERADAAPADQSDAPTPENAQRENESSAARPPSTEKERQAQKRGRGGAAEAAAAHEVEQSSSAYIGLGRYARSDGIVERITPYVRPDQAEALRIAVARKNDPRGTDVSQIIQTLLDEAGYRS